MKRAMLILLSVIALGIVTVVVLFGKWPMLFRDGATLHVRFPNAAGASIGTPVGKSGVLIGRVETVRFVEDSSDVMVAIRLNPGVQLLDNEIPHVSGSLKEGAVVEFVPDPAKVTQQPLKNGAQLKGVVVSTPEDEMGRLVHNLNKLLEGKDTSKVNQALQKTEQAMDSINKTMANLNDLVGDEKVRGLLKQDLTALAGVIEDARIVATGMKQVVARADKNMENLELLTGPLGQRGEQIAERLDSSVTQLDQTLRTFVEIGNNLHSFSEDMNSAYGIVRWLTRPAKAAGRADAVFPRVPIPPPPPAPGELPAQKRAPADPMPPEVEIPRVEIP